MHNDIHIFWRLEASARNPTSFKISLDWLKMVITILSYKRPSDKFIIAPRILRPINVGYWNKWIKKVSNTLSASYPHSFKSYCLVLIVISTTLRHPTNIGLTRSTRLPIPPSVIFHITCAAGTIWSSEKSSRRCRILKLANTGFAAAATRIFLSSG